MPSLGVSSLDLGRLRQRRRPLFWFIYRCRYLPLICLLVAGACWHRQRGWLDSARPGLRSRANAGGGPAGRRDILCPIRHFRLRSRLLLAGAAGRRLIAKRRTMATLFAAWPIRRRDGSSLNVTSRTGCSRWPGGRARPRRPFRRAREAASRAAEDEEEETEERVAKRPRSLKSASRSSHHRSYAKARHPRQLPHSRRWPWQPIHA